MIHFHPSLPFIFLLLVLCCFQRCVKQGCHDNDDDDDGWTGNRENPWESRCKSWQERVVCVMTGRLRRLLSMTVEWPPLFPQTSLSASLCPVFKGVDHFQECILAKTVSHTHSIDLIWCLFLMMIPRKTKWLKKHKRVWSWKVMIITVTDDAADDRLVSSSLCFPLLSLSNSWWWWQSFSPEVRRWLASYYPYTFTLISLLIVLSRDLSHVSVEYIGLCVSLSSLPRLPWVFPESSLCLLCVTLGKYFAFSSFVTSSVIISVFFMTRMSVLLSSHSLLCSWCYSSLTIISCHLIRAQKGSETEKSCKIYAKGRRCERYTFLFIFFSGKDSKEMTKSLVSLLGRKTT